MVYVFLTEGNEIVEALTPVDVLRRAGIEVRTVSLTQNKVTESSCGVEVNADCIFDECDFSGAEAIVLPGGAGTANYFEHEGLQKLVRSHHEKGRLIAAICAAPRVLAKNGIHVTSAVYPTFKDEIADYCAHSVCVCDNVITGRAMAASLEFSLKIVEVLRGAMAAKLVADAVCL